MEHLALGPGSTLAAVVRSSDRAVCGAHSLKIFGRLKHDKSAREQVPNTKCQVASLGPGMTHSGHY